MARRNLSVVVDPDAPKPIRIATVPTSDGPVVMRAVTGRMLLTVTDLNVSDVADAGKVIRLLGDSCISHPWEGELIDQPFSRLIQILSGWLKAAEEDAIPPTNAKR